MHWSRYLPADLEVHAVQAPGRAERIDEPAYSDLDQLANAVTEMLCEHLAPPFAFFGHSMGALLAYAVTHRLRKRAAAQPTHLLVSALAAPALPRRMPPIHLLSPKAFRDRLAVYGGTPAEVLRSDELLQVLLPALRADFAVVETYHYQATEPLACPIIAYGGDQDPGVNYAELEAWHSETTGLFAVRVFPGHHFYMNQSSAIFTAIVQDLGLR
jgi:surfactin synthase thioesterase subunit